MKKAFLILLCGVVMGVKAQTPMVFPDLKAVLDHAEKYSYTALLGQKQQEMATLTRQAAIGQVVNPRIPTSAAITDNTRQPVSFIPAEIFGGPAGSFREITMGQQYVANFSIAPQFDIVNMANIGRYKSAQINEKLVENQNLTTKKALFEQIAAVYHNIVSYRAQIHILVRNQATADSLVSVVVARQKSGIARQQEVNEARINSLSLADKRQQLAAQVVQQLTQLALLCDVAGAVDVAEVALVALVAEVPTALDNPLALKQWTLQQEMTAQELKIAYYQHLPTLSFASAFNWQNNSNNRFFDGNAKWINSNYWGLRLSWDLPTTVPKLTQLKNTQLTADMQAVNARHVALQTQKQTQQMQLDWERAQSQWQHYGDIVQLRADTYQKYYNQYEAGLIGLDRVLMAQNEWIMGQLNQEMALAQMAFIKSKIDINNQIK